MRSVIDNWREDYNHRRPHSTLGYMPPAVFAAGWGAGGGPHPPPPGGYCPRAGFPPLWCQRAGTNAHTVGSTTMQTLDSRSTCYECAGQHMRVVAVDFGGGHAADGRATLFASRGTDQVVLA